MKRVSRSILAPQREDHKLRGSCVEGFEPALEFRMRHGRHGADNGDVTVYVWHWLAWKDGKCDVKSALTMMRDGRELHCVN